MKISACTLVNSFGLGPHFGQQNEYISVKKIKRMDHVQSCQLFLEYCAFKIENNTDMGARGYGISLRVLQSTANE